MKSVKFSRGEETISREQAYQKALETVLLFHGEGQWDITMRRKWEEITGSPVATTRSLCDYVRRVLKEGK